PEPQMIGIAEDDPRVEIGRLEFFETNALDGAGSADRHKHRRLNLATARGQHTRPRLTVLGLDLESSRRYFRHSKQSPAQRQGGFAQKTQGASVARIFSRAKAQRRKALPRFRRFSLRLCAFAREISSAKTLFCKAALRR